MRTIHRSAGTGIPRKLAKMVIAVVLTTTAITTGVTAAEAGATSGNAPQAATRTTAAPRITWGTCPPLAEGADRHPRLTCGTLQVPLDYRNPRGEKIEVAVSKLPATRSRDRRGVLLLNPGGPASPGLDTPGDVARTLPPSVRAAYDLIGFDPRGVAHSTPQSCGFDDPSLAGLFPYPAADGSITKNVDDARADAELCAANAGEKLRYFTTANTARDMDLIRAALGEKKISYWGQSYGTYLGAVYESLFPRRADRVVLEGNVDPTKVWAGAKDNWGKAMAERFPDAARIAAAQHATLGLGNTVDEVTQRYLALAEHLDHTPAPVPGTSLALTGSMLRTVTYSLLLHNDKLPVLTQFWKAAVGLTDGTLTEADGQVLEQVFAGPAPTPGVPADNQATMFLALTCGDAQWSDDVDGYARRTAQDRAAWPLTAGMPANIWACAFWPEPIEAPVRVTDKGPRNTLILQNRRDNATPWEDGLGLYRALGRRAAFVGADNGGHYVYGQGSACVDNATVTFLTTGRLPHKTVYCTDVASAATTSRVRLMTSDLDPGSGTTDGSIMTVTVREEAWDDADGARLRDDMRSELAARYGIPDQEVEAPTAETVSVFLIARDPDGVATGCGALRVLDNGTGEIKRMYVSPHARGTGVATSILRALEDHARRLGITSLVLSTGTEQPDAMRFYEREGYRPTDGYGPYIGQPMARCFTIDLT